MRDPIYSSIFLSESVIEGIRKRKSNLLYLYIISNERLLLFEKGERVPNRGKERGSLYKWSRRGKGGGSEVERE